jgi:uncharacterized protein
MDDRLRNRMLSSVTSKILRLTIYPTEQCNFRCRYCYQYYKNGKMSSETVNALLLFLEKRLPTLNVIHINWFGGEPLLAQDIIRQTSEVIQNGCRGNSSLRYVGNITTNGYLLNLETFKKLTGMGIRAYQITLDGLEERHNRTRKLINGGGTFATIWNNLLAIKNSSCDGRIQIRLNYTEENYKGVVQIIEKIKNELLTDRRFKVYFRPIEKFGGRNDDEIKSVQFERQKEITRYFKSVLGCDVDCRERFDNYICYASQLNSFVIRSNGVIQKCDLGLDLDANNVGVLNNDGTLNIDRRKFLMWSKGLETQDEKMLSCPYFHYFMAASGSPK